MSYAGAVPVIMYHTVGKTIEGWNWSFLTVPWKAFDSQMSVLANKGYRSAGLDELKGHLIGKKTLGPRRFVLTFDDGYLDNYTHAAPILAKYGFTATVFVSPDFVDPEDVLRKTLLDVERGDCVEADLETRGFMSWRELAEIERTGTFSVQSHLMTHTWYPSGQTVVDFHHPGDSHYWLDWNADPAKKPYYLRQPQESSVPFGTPVYEHAKSMAVRRYRPPENESAHMAAFVEKRGGANFFSDPKWREILFSELESYRWKSTRPEGRYETEERKNARIRGEILESKSIIQNRLSKKVDYMAWPGGGYDERAVAYALEEYALLTMNSREGTGCRNRPGESEHKYKRIGVPYIEAGGALWYPGGGYLERSMREFRGERMARLERQVSKALLLPYLAVSARRMTQSRYSSSAAR